MCPKKLHVIIICGLFAALLMICLPTGVLAAPPLITDDPGTPGPGKWETNIGFTVEKSREESVFSAPVLDLNYGIGEHLQINYEVSWVLRETEDEDAKDGIGNSEIALKWRFLDEDKDGVNLSVYPRVILNNSESSANRGLVDKGTVFRLPFQLEKKIGPIIINPEFGHDFRRVDGDQWFGGLALKYDGVKGLEILAEVFGTADNEFKNQENVFNVGFQKDMGEHFSLLASAGSGLRRTADHPRLLSYLGGQIRF